VFDNSSVQTIKKLFGENEDAKVSVSVDDMTESADKLRFDIYLSKNDEKVKHTEFVGGSVTVTIPLENRLGDLNGKNVKVYYVERDEQGNETKRTEMTEGFNFDRENKKVTFKTNHFSEYEVEATNAHVHNYTVAWNWTGNDTDGYTKATATFTCTGETGCGDEQTVDATVTTTETDTAITYTASAVEFNGKSYTTDPMVVAKQPATETVTVTVENKTGSQNPATVTAPETGTIGAAYTFTVTCDKACVVAYTTDGGVTYTSIKAEKVEDKANTYSFTITLENDMQFAVVIKGDINGDGFVNATDAGIIKAVSLNKPVPLNGLATLIADINKDTYINATDAGILKALSLNKPVPLNW
jgi:hypothetical protein